MGGCAVTPIFSASIGNRVMWMSKKLKKALKKASKATKAVPAFRSSPPAADGAATPAGPAPAADTERRLALARAAVEAWRIERRAAGAGDERLTESARRLLGELEAAGCRLEDPVGTPYIDGAVMDVIGEVPQGVALQVAETIRPAVYVDGNLQLAAQVMVAPKE